MHEVIASASTDSNQAAWDSFCSQFLLDDAPIEPIDSQQVVDFSPEPDSGVPVFEVNA